MVRDVWHCEEARPPAGDRQRASALGRIYSAALSSVRGLPVIREVDTPHVHFVRCAFAQKRTHRVAQPLPEGRHGFALREPAQARGKTVAVPHRGIARWVVRYRAKSSAPRCTGKEMKTDKESQSVIGSLGMGSHLPKSQCEREHEGSICNSYTIPISPTH